MLRKELEAQIAYVAKKNHFGLSEAKAQVSLLCHYKSTERRESNVTDDLNIKRQHSNSEKGELRPARDLGSVSDINVDESMH